MEEIFRKQLTLGIHDVEEQLQKLQNARIEAERQQEQIFDLPEGETRLKTLSQKVLALKEELENNGQIFDKKIHELEKQEELVRNLLDNKKRLDDELASLEVKKTNLQKMQLSPHDLELLKNAQEKLSLYKSFTGIRWNYPEINEAIKGFVTDKKEYISAFNFRIETDKKVLADHLWEKVEKCARSSSQKDETISNDENIPCNT